AHQLTVCTLVIRGAVGDSVGRLQRREQQRVTIVGDAAGIACDGERIPRARGTGDLCGPAVISDVAAGRVRDAGRIAGTGAVYVERGSAGEGDGYGVEQIRVRRWRA